MGDRFEREPEHHEASSSYSEDVSSAEAKETYRGVDAYSGSDDTAEKLHRDSYGGQAGGAKKDALSILLRLAEALETDEGAEYYPEDGSDSQLLKKDVDYNPEVLDSYVSNPKKGFKRRHAKIIEEEDEEEEEEEDKLAVYEAEPFNSDIEAMDPDYNPKHKFPLPKEAADSTAQFNRYKKKWRVNWYGSTTVFLYCCALVFYLFIRITKTMDLGSYLVYGIFVLFVEVMGASTTLLYGVNLLLDPVYDPVAEDKENPGLPLVNNAYHLRVLVPCYKESLELVQRTVTAALDAVLPANCYRTVYLCDDGKDPQKRKWCQRMGPDLQYVSGRTRGPGEMNGKSSNLNNCLEQIYPAGCIIPHNELVCIFDADQLANSDFYIKTVPLFDLGDDVGMVLSPQAFHNLRLHADIFNHANIHFWEYSQPGYDALGFISCTGTNFLCRATALQEAGWSPTYTLTEDFALGMIMKANKWHCCYVEEYLAIGEAPEQVRNCFQQRSRWCKGHFQVVMSRKHCPLWQRGLSFGMRVMYCSGVWSYIVGALTAPTFIVIPLLTIWAGIFPIVISWWAALALTVYFIAQTAVLSYSKKFKHIESLWFAGIANNILWFTFVKACFRSLTTVFGQKITFKTTLKGMNKLADSAVGDLWMPMLSMLLLCVSLGFGISKLSSGPTVITTLAISVVWIVYGIIPPYLLAHYTLIGRGTTLQFMCRILFCLSYACGICALLLLWAVYPKDYDFGQATGDSILFFDAQRVGTLPDDRIPWRHDALLYEGSEKLGFPDLTGGWLNGGLIGDVKLTMPAAFTTAMLAWGLLSFPSGYAQAGQTEWIENEIKWGTDYLLKTIKNNQENVTLVYQVGNLTSDIPYWAPPENMTQAANPRPVYTINSATGTSDLAGQLVSAFASAAIVQSKLNATNGQNGTYYNTLMDAATMLYDSAKTVQGRYTAGFNYNCISPYAKSLIGSNSTAATCESPTDFNDGSALAVYNSTTFYDDLVWAASWMYYATGNLSYLTDAQNFYQLHLNEESGDDGELLTDWDNVYWASNVLLANLTNTGAYHTAVQGMLMQWICGTNGQIRFTPRGRAWNTADGSTGITQNAAFLALVYGEMDSDLISAGQKSKYVCFSRTQVRYLLGDAGRSLMTGFGKNPPTHVQNRAASCSSTNDCDQANALLVATANPHILSGAVPQFADFSDSYLDVRTENASRVDIGNNVAITGTCAGLTNAPGTWEQCLQGFGVLTSDTAVCNNNNAG